jgi:TfoX/Sxy family transcriptional regulator of competence genes
MASDQDLVEFVVDQIEDAGDITFRKMFGEYAVYCSGKVVLLICDNQVFVKPTQAGREFIGDVVEAPPYPGAKPSFLIQDLIEEKEWMCKLVRLTEQELTMPKPKKRGSRSSGRRQRGDRPLLKA